MQVTARRRLVADPCISGAFCREWAPKMAQNPPGPGRKNLPFFFKPNTQLHCIRFQQLVNNYFIKN